MLARAQPAPGIPAPVELRLLGGFEATRDGKPLSGFESDRARALLAYLAVERGRLHRRETLATLLWPDQPADISLHRLRQALANVRAVLGDNDAAAPALTVTRTDLGIAPGCAVWLDVSTFDELLRDCRRHSHRAAESCRWCLRRLEQAVELCPGAFLQGLTMDDSDLFEVWVTAQRQRVEEQLTAVLARLAGHYEREGDYGRVQHYALRQLRFEPWAEEAHCRLMLALARSGQRSAALRQYKLCQAALREELGVEASAETQRLAQQLERGVLPPPAPRPRHNLPAQLTRFVGRETEIAELQELLASRRFVTLTGTGGCGKTRLALEVAASLRRDFKEGVWLIELEPVADAELLARTAARVFNVTEDAKHSAAENLADHLRGKEALLILDNCEHVIGAAAAFADRLLRNCPDVCVLATSREALRVTGETVRHIAPLPVAELDAALLSSERLLAAAAASDAVQLFLERTSAVRPDLSLTAETAPAVAGICRELDGIPLALELAASWADRFSVAEVQARLEDRRHFLERGSRSADPRHQTLEALIDWSYELLTAEQRAVFRQLSVFSGGGPVAAVDAVCGACATEALRELAAKSLLRIDAPPEGERFQMLETLRAYARQRLEDSGEAASVASRHARYFLGLAETHAPPSKWAGRVDHEAQEAIHRERDNLRAALAWARSTGDGDAELRLASACAWYWYNTGQLRLGLERLEHALTTDAGQGTGSAPEVRRERANALLATGCIARLSGDLTLAHERLEQALQLSHEIGERLGVAGASRGLAWLAAWQGDYAAAATLTDDALPIYRDLQDAERAAWVTQEQGWLASLAGDNHRARLLLEDAVARFTSLGQPRGAMYAQGVLGMTLLDLGHLGEAQKELAQALSLLIAAKDRIFAPYLLEACAAFASEAGLAERALELLGAASLIRDRNAQTPIPAAADRIERVLIRARAALDAESAAAAWDRGQSMTQEEALACALPPEPPFR